MCFFLFTKQVSDISWEFYQCNSILIPSAWTLLEISQVKGLVLQDYPTVQMPLISSRAPGYPQILSRLATFQRFSCDPSLLSVYLLEQLRELRETFSHIYQFSKVYDEGYR